MVTVTQTAPAASISTLVDAVFTGLWTRAGLDREDNIVELVEIELFRHETSHTGEVALWTLSGAVTAADSYADSYTVALPPAIDLAGDYCWQVRLRDNFGSWTAWSSKAVFAFASVAPVLSTSTLPTNFPEFETLRHVFFGAAYSDADGDRPHRLYVRLYKAVSEEVVTVDDEPYMGNAQARVTRPNDNNEDATPDHAAQNWAINWDNDGDNPKAGDAFYPLAGPLAYVGVLAERTGIEVLATGTVTVTLACSVSEIVSGSHTFTFQVRNNGGSIGSSANTTTGGLRIHGFEIIAGTSLVLPGIAVVPGDVLTARIDATVGATGSHVTLPTGVGNSGHWLIVTAGPGDLVVGEEITETVWSFDTDILLWATEGQYEGLADSEAVGTWYNGRGLGPGTYYWTMTATDRRGTESNELSGYLTVTKGWEPDPGSSPNLTGYATP
jgi:hypothetical protein